VSVQSGKNPKTGWSKPGDILYDPGLNGCVSIPRDDDVCMVVIPEDRSVISQSSTHAGKAGCVIIIVPLVAQLGKYVKQAGVEDVLH